MEARGPSLAQASADDRLLAAIVHSSGDAVVSKDLAGIITSWNQAAQRLYGYEAVEVLGRSISLLCERDRLDEMGAILAKIRGGERVEHFETVRIKKDGTTCAVSLTVSPILGANGAITGASTISRDVSERRRLETRCEGYLEAAPDAIVVVGADGLITLVNAQTEKLFGYPRAQLLGRPVELLVPERFRSQHSGHRSAYFMKPKARSMGSGGALYGLRGDGTEFPVEISLTPFESAAGTLVATTIRDVTSQKQSSQYVRSLIEASLDPLVTISPEGKITDVNQATIGVTGVDRERLIGTDFSDYFTAPEEARAGYKQVFANGFVTDYPLTIRHQDGHETDVLYNASVYKDAGGHILGVFAAARDVTAQKQASQYARSLIEASLDPLVTISPEGKITDVNQATIEVTGVERERLIGTDFSDYFTAPEEARAGYKQVFANGFVTDYPLTIRHQDGHETDVLYNASVYKDPGGQILGVFAAARDVTAQKQASQYARSLIEASLDPLVTISPSGKITDVNNATIMVTGVSRGKLIGTDFSDYFTESDKAGEGYKQVFQQGFVIDYPLTIRHTDGALVDVLYNASVYKDVSGKVLGVFAAARDITARKEADTARKKAEAEVSDQRAKELERLAELERFQKLTIGRELKMIDLKREIAELKRLIPLAQP